MANKVQYPTCEACKHNKVCKFKEKIEDLKKQITVSEKVAEKFDFINVECKCKYYESAYASTDHVTLWSNGQPQISYNPYEITCLDSQSTAATLVVGSGKSGLMASSNPPSTVKEN